MMQQLKKFGYHCEAPDLELWARAAVYRVASQSEVFLQCINVKEYASDSVDALLRHPYRHWLQNSRTKLRNEIGKALNSLRITLPNIGMRSFPAKVYS